MDIKIASIGLFLPTIEKISLTKIYTLNHNSESLTEFDIIIYDLSCSQKIRPRRSSRSSEGSKNALIHWEAEFKSILEQDKTIFVNCSSPTIFSSQSSEKGKIIKDAFYPLAGDNNIQFRDVKGADITVMDKKGIFQEFYNNISAHMTYEFVFSTELNDAVFFRKNTNDIVGGVMQFKKGNIVFLPKISNYSSLDSYKKYIFGLVKIQQSLKNNSSNKVMAPEWIDNTEFTLHKTENLVFSLRKKKKSSKRLKMLLLSLKNRKAKASSQNNFYIQLEKS